MAIYISKDIKTDDGGEIQFENGDLVVATVKRSHLQALHWLMATSRNDTLHGDAVGDLGSWIGRLNHQRNRRSMEEQLRRAIGEQRLFSPGDIVVAVTPVEVDAVAVLGDMRGIYSENDPDDEEDGYATLAYVYPFSTGVLVRVS